MPRIMKLQYRAVAIFALVLLLTISSSSNRTQASRLLLSKMHASSMASSSQTLKGLQGKKQDPFKKVDSSFRKIPPSRSNPTQNKYKPPCNNYDQSTKQKRRLTPRPAL